MDRFSLIAPLIAGASIFLATIIASRGFKSRTLANAVEGRKTRGHVSINGHDHHVTLIVNERQLAIRSFLPSFSIILNLDDLRLSKVRAFIGTSIQIQAPGCNSDSGFSEMIISHSLARKLEKLSNGKFDYRSK